MRDALLPNKSVKVRHLGSRGPECVESESTKEFSISGRLGRERGITTLITLIIIPIPMQGSSAILQLLSGVVASCIVMQVSTRFFLGSCRKEGV